MNMTLDELVPYLRKNVPQSKAIKNLVADQKAGVVTFEWQARRFAVRTSLETFEMKQTRLFVTGASGLLQVILASKTRHQTVVGELVDKLDEALDVVKKDQQKAMTLLQPVKTKLAALAGKRTAKR